MGKGRAARSEGKARATKARERGARREARGRLARRKAIGSVPMSLRHHFGIRSAPAEGDERVARPLQVSRYNLRKFDIHERELIINCVWLP